MNILFDIGHPAHIHYFKNTIQHLKRNGHQVTLTARDKERSLYLIEKLGFDYFCTGKNLSSKLGKLYSILRNDLRIYRIARKVKPDVFVSFFSPFAAHVGALLGKPVIGFNDTESAKISIRLTEPYTDTVVIPKCYKGDFPAEKKVVFDGYFELSYLHPNYFQPDPSVLGVLGVQENETYTILRFVGWGAVHDIGHSGLTLEMKRKAVTEFSTYGKVFISSEKELPDDLKQYKFNLPPEKMHDALYYASLLYGESATMASECAVLGTHAIYLDNEGRGYTDEQETDYGLVYNYSESIEDQEDSIQKGIELLRTPNLKSKAQDLRRQLLSDKIDVTAFMVWLIENYPESSETIRKNPDYFKNFRHSEQKVTQVVPSKPESHFVEEA